MSAGETVTVKFRKGIIAPYGEIKMLEISQKINEYEIASVLLTIDQARSLAKEIERRIGEQ